MSLIRYQYPELASWSSYDRLASLRDEVNRLFEAPILNRELPLFGNWTPALDVYQDKENLYVTLEVPGVKKEEIEISLHESALSISGERTKEVNQGQDNGGRSERTYGRFQRSVQLPHAINADKVTAACKDGILTVTLPKAEEAKPRQIEVQVS